MKPPAVRENAATARPTSPRFSANNFDLLRFAFAFTVVLVHSHELSNRHELHIFSALLSSSVAVQGFFVVSGLLVFMSYETSSSLSSYVSKRVRRIYPAYFTVVVLCAFLLGACSTVPAKDYYLSADFFKYLAANLSFANFLHPDLPGVFNGNKLNAVNGALWTLKIEVMFYAAVPVIVWLFNRFGRAPVMLAIFLSSVAYAIAMGRFAETTGSPTYQVLAHQLPAQLCYFIAGAFFYYYFELFERHVAWFFASAVALYFADRFIGVPIATPIWLATFVAVFGFFFYAGNFGRYGDMSYGIYIAHFPILQTLIFFGFFDTAPLTTLLVAVFTILICSFALWHLLEKHFLRRRLGYLQAADSSTPAMRPAKV